MQNKFINKKPHNTTNLLIVLSKMSLSCPAVITLFLKICSKPKINVWTYLFTTAFLLLDKSPCYFIRISFLAGKLTTSKLLILVMDWRVATTKIHRFSNKHQNFWSDLTKSIFRMRREFNAISSTSLFYFGIISKDCRVIWNAISLVVLIFSNNNCSYDLNQLTALEQK
jgi:hypothetical protein